MRQLLVIDDDVEVRTVIQAHGESAGWTVHGVATAAAGLTTLNDTQPDVVVLDVMLPDQSGWDVLAAIPNAKPARTSQLAAASGQATGCDRGRPGDRGAGPLLPPTVTPAQPRTGKTPQAPLVVGVAREGADVSAVARAPAGTALR